MMLCYMWVDGLTLATQPAWVQRPRRANASIGDNMGNATSSRMSTGTCTTGTRVGTKASTRDQ